MNDTCDFLARELSIKARELTDGMRERVKRDPDIADFRAAFQPIIQAELNRAVAGAYEQAAQQADDWIINPPPFKPDNLTGAIAAAKLIAEHIRTLTPADALAHREREIAKARLEEANIWRQLKADLRSDSLFFTWADERIAALQSATGKGS